MRQQRQAANIVACSRTRDRLRYAGLTPQPQISKISHPFAWARLTDGYHSAIVFKMGSGRPCDSAACMLSQARLYSGARSGLPKTGLRQPVALGVSNTCFPEALASRRVTSRSQNLPAHWGRASHIHQVRASSRAPPPCAYVAEKISHKGTGTLGTAPAARSQAAAAHELAPGVHVQPVDRLLAPAAVSRGRVLVGLWRWHGHRLRLLACAQGVGV